MNITDRISLWVCPYLKEVEQLKCLRASSYRGMSAEAKAFLAAPPRDEIDAVLSWLEEENHHLIAFGDEAYPQLLAEIDNPPPFLSVIGQLKVLQEPQLGIVGCRSMSHYGAQNAFQFAKALAEMGVTVTSGLARGIDALAHEGALAGGGSTIAIVGAGLNCLYPREHKGLAEKIALTGAVVSEFPLNREPANFQFPMRNRIISGLSLGVLVVEAAQKSGSLITARCALKQNREVYAIPGSIHSTTSKGCHSLIRDGATLVESLPDLLREVKEKLESFVLSPAPLKQNLQDPQKHDTDLKRLFKKGAFLSTDQLLELTGQSIDALSTELLMLELASAIRLTPAGYTLI